MSDISRTSLTDFIKHSKSSDLLNLPSAKKFIASFGTQRLILFVAAAHHWPFPTHNSPSHFFMPLKMLSFHTGAFSQALSFQIEDIRVENKFNKFTELHQWQYYFVL